MARKRSIDKLSVYIPQDKQRANLGERLLHLAKKKDRSVNYLVVEAIIEYLEREERKS